MHSKERRGRGRKAREKKETGGGITQREGKFTEKNKELCRKNKHKHVRKKKTSHKNYITILHLPRHRSSPSLSRLTTLSLNPVAVPSLSPLQQPQPAATNISTVSCINSSHHAQQREERAGEKSQRKKGDWGGNYAERRKIYREKQRILQKK